MYCTRDQFYVNGVRSLIIKCDIHHYGKYFVTLYHLIYVQIPETLLFPRPIDLHINTTLAFPKLNTYDIAAEASKFNISHVTVMISSPEYDINSKFIIYLELFLIENQ